MINPLAPRNGIRIKNDNASEIPPRSAVMVTSVETTTATATQESETFYHVDQFNGSSNATIAITSSVAIPAGGYGTGFLDDFIYVSIEPTDPDPANSEEWGPNAGSWTLHKGGTGFIAQGYSANGSDIKRAVFYRQTASTGGSSNSGCGCCNCFDCLTDVEATVGGCDAAPDGAAYEYSINIGNWGGYSIFAPDGLITLSYGAPSGCESSSSSSSSSSPDGGCRWYSCIYCVAETIEDSAVVSPRTGCYQFIGEISTDGSGMPAFAAVPTLVSGDDWIEDYYPGFVEPL